MSDAMFFLLFLVCIVSFCILLVKRNRRTDNPRSNFNFIEMLLMRPVAFMKEDVYGIVMLAGFVLIAAFPNTDPSTTMFKGGAHSDEDLALIVLAALGLGIFVFLPRLWWATGIPQRFLDEDKPKEEAKPPSE